MEFRHLRYFVAVAEALSFARAARALNLSQPPLSRQIRALEDELGTPLFARTKRSVQLTPAGAALLPEARRLLREADGLKAGAQRLAAGEVGTLALGFISVAAYNLLPELAPEFRRRHPGVKLVLQEATSDVLIAGLRQGDLDVGLVLPPVDAPGLEYAPLVHDTLIAALPAGADQARGRGPIRLAALADEPFILFPRRVGSSLYDEIVGACRRAGFAPRIEQEAIQMQTIVSLVAARMGVALVPASLEHLRRTGVVYRPLADARSRVEIGIAWRAGDASPAVRAFVALARERRGRR
jgi:DNA-binding transcriptional LysR family regulator